MSVKGKLDLLVFKMMPMPHVEAVAVLLTWI